MSSIDPPGSPAAVPPAAPGGDDRNQRWIIVLLLLALAAVVAAFATYVLTDDDEEAAVTSSESTTPPESSSGGSSSGGGAPATPSTPDPPASAPCSGDAFLAAVGGEIDGIAVAVTGSTCTATSGGYAIATMEPADPTVIADALTVFFEDTGGTWAVLTYGTGVTCTEAGIPADACAQLPATGG